MSYPETSARQTFSSSSKTLLWTQQHLRKWRTNSESNVLQDDKNRLRLQEQSHQVIPSVSSLHFLFLMQRVFLVCFICETKIMQHGQNQHQQNTFLLQLLFILPGSSMKRKTEQTNGLERNLLSVINLFSLHLIKRKSSPRITTSARKSPPNCLIPLQLKFCLY